MKIDFNRVNLSKLVILVNSLAKCLGSQNAALELIFSSPKILEHLNATMNTLDTSN